MRIGKAESEGFRRRFRRWSHRDHYWRAARSWLWKQSPTSSPILAAIRPLQGEYNELMNEERKMADSIYKEKYERKKDVENKEV